MTTPSRLMHISNYGNYNRQGKMPLQRLVKLVGPNCPGLRRVDGACGHRWRLGDGVYVVRLNRRRGVRRRYLCLECARLARLI